MHAMQVINSQQRDKHKMKTDTNDTCDSNWDQRDWEADALTTGPVTDITLIWYDVDVVHWFVLNSSAIKVFDFISINISVYTY